MRQDDTNVGDGLFWRRSRATEVGVIADGRDYFRAAKQAMLAARHSIFLIGWDFDARIELEPEGSELAGPSKIGAFLNWLARENNGVQVRLLKWNLGVLRSLGRGETPLFILNWLGRSNVQLRLDSAHPVEAAHHMKLVVIDDALAFCGGIDVTVGRWDTPQHLEDDPHRRAPWGRHLKPWHDVTTCIRGAAVRDLGDLARERWRRATGEQLPAPAPALRDCEWPSLVRKDFCDVDVGIARTSPAFEDYPQVAEIEAVTLHLIRHAERTLYIENQYLASREMAEAIAARLDEPDGPEVVMIMPETADGWLEAKTMDSARARLLNLLRKADRHGRFRAYFPVNAAGTAIYVHAKVVIADERVLKIGSANLNNRSMGYDTECDVVIEAQCAADPAEVSRAIARRRNALLAEHLGLAPEAVAEVTEQAGGLVAGIDALGSETRCPGLRPVEARPLRPEEELIAETDLVDPERPKKLGSRIKDMLFSAVPG